MSELPPPAPVAAPSGGRRHLLIGGVVGLLGLLALAAVVVVVLVARRSDSSASALDTQDAATRLQQVLDDALVGETDLADLDECPAGPAVEVLDEVAVALGGGDLQTIVDEGEIMSTARLVAPTTRLVDCTASADGEGLGGVGLLVATQPEAVLADVGRDQGGAGYEEIGEGRGGRYAARCGPAADGDCAVVWYDDRLLIGIGGAGPAIGLVEVTQVRVALDELLPTLVDGLADR